MRIYSNKVKDIIRFAKNELNTIYSEKEIDSFLFIMFSHFLNWTSSKVLLEKENTVSESVLLDFNFAIKDLKKQKPIQYITGKAYFAGLYFNVNEHTLIPRPETEELIQLIVNKKNESDTTILDIGTGSGCIAICLAAKMKNATVSACDISEKALETAVENAKRNDVIIQFDRVDILNCEDAYNQQNFDIIVSNPPYVCQSEKKLMNDNVLLYEPHSALFVADTEPLLFYERIVDFSINRLSQNGKLYFEINERFGQQTIQLLQSKSFAVILHKDFNGKDRFVEAWLNK